MSTYAPGPFLARPPGSEKAVDAIENGGAEWEGRPGPSAQEAPAPEGRSGERGAGAESAAPRCEPGGAAKEDSPRHTERRRRPRGVPGFEPNRAQLVSTTLGSYREMPGLALFVHQAARLFAVSTGTCQLMLDDLVKDNRLRRDDRGQYVL